MAEQTIRTRDFTDIATDSDLQNADNYILLDTERKTKKLEITRLAKASDVASLEAKENDWNGYFADKTGDLLRTTCTELDVGIGNAVSLGTRTANDYKGTYKPCVKGQSFKVKGQGHFVMRLWGFTDTNSVLLAVASASATENNYITITAPADGYVVVNGFATTVGFEVQEKSSTKFESLDFEIAESRERVDFVNEMCGNFKDRTASFVRNKSIALNGSVGSQVDFTGSSPSDWSSVYIECSKNQAFKIKGVGGYASRLWGFTDSEGKLIVASGPSVTASNYITIMAPADGYVVVNANTSNAKGFLVQESVSGKFTSVDGELKSINDDIKAQTVFCGYFEDESESLVRGASIDLDVGIGNQVDLTGRDVTDFRGTHQTCVKGQAFKVIGVGGSVLRLWGFTDDNGILLEVADSNTTASEEITLIAPADGYVVVNCRSGNNPRSFRVQKPADDFVKNLDSRVTTLETDTVTSDAILCTRGSVVYIDGDIGDTITLEYTQSGGWESVMVPCNEGDSFVLYGRGGSRALLYAFVDSDSKIVSKAASQESLTEKTKFVAPCTGTFVYNNLVSQYEGYVGKAVPVESKIDAAIQSIYSHRVQLVPDSSVIEIDTVFSSAFDFSSSTLRKTTMEQTYAFMDSLVAAHSDIMERIDAAEYVGLSYPQYAIDEDYKTYMYKISGNNVYAGNGGYYSTNNKKPLFIYAGEHGGEIFAVSNVAIFAYRLVEQITEDDNLFKIFSMFDVYILPCLNGAGIRALSRTNYNGVNINRNYPSKNWQVAGEGTNNYTGPSAGSEFETQLIMGIIDKLNPFVSIDHHNYGDSNRQFYTAVCEQGALHNTYELLTLISLALKKKYPSYFGSNYGLLISAWGDVTAPILIEHQAGRFGTWASDNDIKAFTFEVSETINYENGEVVSPAIGKYGAAAVNVAEYTLRAHLVVLLQYFISNYWKD